MLPIVASTIVAAALALAGSGMARADTAKGGMLAAQLCAGCHAVRVGQTSPKPEAPPFATVAGSAKWNIFTLRPYLRTPHWTSTNLSLKADDIDDLVGYIMSLRPRP